MPVFCQVDDKHVPLYRIVWISDLPHFCGDDECQREGQYEIRLDAEESVWSSLAERDAAVEALEAWLRGGQQTGRRNPVRKDAIAMSTFENDRYQWRETYFVLFPAARRPALEDGPGEARRAEQPLHDRGRRRRRAGACSSRSP